MLPTIVTTGTNTQLAAWAMKFNMEIANFLANIAHRPCGNTKVWLLHQLDKASVLSRPKRVRDRLQKKPAQREGRSASCLHDQRFDKHKGPLSIDADAESLTEP